MAFLNFSLDYLMQKVNENWRVHLSSKTKKQLSLKEYHIFLGGFTNIYCYAPRLNISHL